MKKKTGELDVEELEKLLGAKSKGYVRAGGGYLGALQLAADVRARFQTPHHGGRGTNPDWTDRRLIPLNQSTLRQLERLATTVSEESGKKVSPLQVAALLLEHALKKADK